MNLLGRLFGWEKRPRPDDIPPGLARILAGHVAAGLMREHVPAPPGVGGLERAIREERDRARSHLMMLGAMVASGTSDEAAQVALELAGRAYRDGERG